MIRLAIGSLSAIACGLALLVGWELGAFAPNPGPVVAQYHAPPAATAPEATPPDHTNDWLASILARPLFSPDRRPPADGTVVAGGEVAALPRLSGVLVGPFGRSAIFAPDGEKPVIVAEGSRIAAWTVQAIRANTVEVVGPEGKRSLQPSFGNMQAAANPAVPLHVGPSQRQ
jgi:hypothetical protein